MKYNLSDVIDEASFALHRFLIHPPQPITVTMSTFPSACPAASQPLPECRLRLSRTAAGGLAMMAIAFTFFASTSAQAELFLPSIFGDSMVVQRDRPVRVWGWTEPETSVTVRLAGNEATATADAEGRFDVNMPSMPAGGPHELTVEADETKTFRDVLVGEVWICSGQSNMAWPVSRANDADLEALSANFPQIRVISVPQVGTQEPQRDFEGSWSAVTPQSVKDFSAVGYFFGRQLHQTLDVPVGLIDNAWGGSAAEAWVPRDVLEASGDYDSLLGQWDETADDDRAKLQQWQQRRQAWIEGGKVGEAPERPRTRLDGQHRPANLYNGVLLPTVGYTIAGVIWYQGESNAGRAYQYRDLFPLMIQTWREKWGQGDFPFYWVQLADFKAESDQPQPSSWAELREAQTMATDRLDQTGQAVIIDLGEGRDIHPRNKQDVAKRLARLALKHQYGYDIPAESPRFESMTVTDEGRVRLDFQNVGSGLYTFDVKRPVGFTVAGEDRQFHRAEAALLDSDTIEVWSAQVDQPVAVRYAWADNPVSNVQSRDGLPMTPFRTDQWPGVTEPSTSDSGR